MTEILKRLRSNVTALESGLSVTDQENMEAQRAAFGEIERLLKHTSLAYMELSDAAYKVHLDRQHHARDVLLAGLQPHDDNDKIMNATIQELREELQCGAGHEPTGSAQEYPERGLAEVPPIPSEPSRPGSGSHPSVESDS